MTGAEFRGVDVDLLADYIGGALTGTPDESVVATLIADDPAWQAAYESLGGGMAAVAVELGRLEPEPMPDDVAARLEAALGSAPRLTLVRDSGDGAPGVRAKRSGRRMRWATPIAIAAGAVAFVGFGLDYLAGRADRADNSSSSAAGSADESQARSDTAQAPAIAGAQPESGAGKAAMTPQRLATGTDYTMATLAEGPVQALSGSTDTAKPAPTTSLSRLGNADTLRECLDKIAAENGFGPITTETVDYARFDGKPAIVVRFTAKNGRWAWASGPSCGTQSGGADTLAKVPVR